jgi:hypothetical protein
MSPTSIGEKDSEAGVSIQNVNSVRKANNVEENLFATLVALYQSPKLAFGFGLVHISTSFIVLLHHSENPHNGATAGGTLSNCELPRQLVQKISVHFSVVLSGSTNIAQATESKSVRKVNKNS